MMIIILLMFFSCMILYYATIRLPKKWQDCSYTLSTAGMLFFGAVFIFKYRPKESAIIFMVATIVCGTINTWIWLSIIDDFLESKILTKLQKVSVCMPLVLGGIIAYFASVLSPYLSLFIGLGSLMIVLYSIIAFSSDEKVRAAILMTFFTSLTLVMSFVLYTYPH